MLFYLLRSGNLSNLRSTLSASTRRTCRKWYVRLSSAIKFHLQLLFRFNSSDTSSYIVFLNSPSTHKRNILQKAMKPSIKMSRTSWKLSSRCKYKFQFSSFEINKTGKVLLIKTEQREAQICHSSALYANAFKLPSLLKLYWFKGPWRGKSHRRCGCFEILHLMFLPSSWKKD